MTITTNRARLKFHTNAGEVIRLTIPRARIDKTAEAAQASMQAILATEAIIINGSIPSLVHGAEIIETQRTVLV